ncbi:MAG: hypothetical protein ALECFALPRED_008058 [Alectoria fallacina]|uniref:RRM domain-containing protein n=1 Tax=Alectoria fallacina TaxID=1903189 RepID=A0A8H3PF50_9LECA|nr:MAG: hypothetical protein ALECFALPRED_008058 [Alectoria fallacina]
MACTHDHNGTSVSPNSSEEVESHHGTPATKLSPFSPDQVLEDLKHVNQGIVRARVPPPFVLARDQSNFGPNGKAGSSIAPGSQDPFLSVPTLSSYTQSSGDGSKLSPNASTFTPTSLIESVSSNGTPSSSTFQYPLSAPICGTGIQGLGLLSLMSPPNNLRYGPIGKKNVLSGPSDTTTSPTSLPAVSSFGSLVANVGSMKEGRFSTDVAKSRSLMAGPVTRATSAKEIENLLGHKVISPPNDVVFAELAVTGLFYVRFADIRDSDNAYSTIKTRHREWDVQFILPKHFAQKFHPEKFRFPSVSKYEGQILVKAEYAGLPQHFDAVAIGYHIKQALEKYGFITAFELGLVKDSVAAYRAEYSNVNDIDNTLSHLNGSIIAMCTLSIAPYQPDLEGSTERLSKSPGPLIMGQETSLESSLASMSPFDRLNTYGPETSSSPSYSQHPYSTPASRPLAFRKDFGEQQHTPSSHRNYSQGYVGGSSDQSPYWSPNYSTFLNSGLQSPVWSAFNPGAIGQERGTPTLQHQRQGYCPQQSRGQIKIGGRQSHDYASGHHNIVDIDRIREGNDVRTTIMLRNIPNKIDQALLKDIVDETSFGKYDFMYLRIDFANNCNVGYAFINFEDPYSIINFVNARAGHRWNYYNSDKVAEVSYATIQGRDCLVQKFRNSSVMLELPSFRPKIYHTGTGPMTGTEDKFPGPDNPSKMRRSVENAEHVGQLHKACSAPSAN